MTEAIPFEIGLTDEPSGPPRTTMTLLASLVARIRTLALLDGAQAIGSMVAGIAAIGRKVGATDEGARLREALERSRLGANGTALWSALDLDSGPSLLPPRPVYDDLRNDLALLLAPDLEEALGRLTEAQLQSGIGLVAEPEDVTFLDFLAGLWFMAGEVVGLIEAMAGPEPSGAVSPSVGGPGMGGPVLR